MGVVTETFEGIGVGIAVTGGLICAALYALVMSLLWVIVLGVAAWASVKYLHAPKPTVGIIFVSTVAAYILLPVLMSPFRQSQPGSRAEHHSIEV
jgi:hypothetical protein